MATPKTKLCISASQGAMIMTEAASWKETRIPLAQHEIRRIDLQITNLRQLGIQRVSE